MLGSRAGVNKLTMYYFIILNSKNISRLSSIHLAVVAHSSDVKQHGHAKVLEKLLIDMKKLEQGVVLGPHEEKVHGTVVCLPADNLAANELNGFVGSFSAHHYCRFCKMRSSEAKKATIQDINLLRNVRDHNADLRRVHEDPSTVTNHGVKGPCVVDELLYFSPLDSFTPDCKYGFVASMLTSLAKICCDHISQFRPRLSQKSCFQMIELLGSKLLLYTQICKAIYFLGHDCKA